MALGGGVDITYTIFDTNSRTIELTGNGGTLIRYFSNAYCKMVPYSSDPINTDMNIIRNGGQTIYGDEGVFENVESDTFTFSAEDARGHIGKETVKVDMIPYVKLTCNVSNNKPDALGNMDIQCSGDFFNGSFGEVDNTLEVKCKYKKQGDSSFTECPPMTVYKYSRSYTARCSVAIPDFDYKSAYVFEYQATDKLATVTATRTTKSMPVFHWDENDFQFEVPVAVKGDAEITGSLRLGRLRLGDGDYCHISETDTFMTISAPRICLDGDVYVNDNPFPSVESGLWSPTLDSSAVSYYTYSDGWYSKVGNTVTVGFYIKAQCYSGYDTTPISIYGLPFYAAFPSAGGGMCSGAYVGGGFTFQCFVADNYSITTRAQDCNNTSATNLSTSASGCNYRSGGGEITLSGTITYMTS